MPVPIPIRPRKPRHQHIRTKRSNHPHHVRQRRIVPAPLLKRLVRRFRKSKIRHARKPLLHSVILIRRQQLLRPQHAQHIRQIAANLVLPALAAIQRHQQRAHAAPARLQCQHPAIFIIRMRHHLHQPRRSPQPQQFQPQPRHPLILRQSPPALPDTKVPEDPHRERIAARKNSRVPKEPWVPHPFAYFAQGWDAVPPEQEARAAK